LDKRRGWLFQHLLLKHREELFRFRQHQAKMFNALAGYLQDDDIGVGFFAAIVITHDELDFDLHGGIPPAA
jgi:hypothetical protein